MKKNLFVAALSFGLIFVVAPAANAQDDPEVSSSQQFADPSIQNVPVTTYKRGINKPCPKGSDKMFIMDITISDSSTGAFVDSDEAFALVTLRSGRPVIDTDMFLNALDGLRTATYYLYVDKRGAQVRKSSAWNSAVVMGSTPDMAFDASLRKECQERFPSEA